MSQDIDENLEQYFLAIINGERHSARDRLLRNVLFFFSRFYRRAIQFRIWLYNKRVIRSQALGCQVLSIGNLTCGGTGKTPVVEILAKTLSAKGRRVAILSRGYRSKDNRSFLQKLSHKFLSKDKEVPPRVVSNGREVLLPSKTGGDEPFMLAGNLIDSNVVVLVDKDRVKSGRYAIREFDADTLILDDGFQYLKLRPHINIVLVDSTAPFHNHHVLPRGLLREPIKNIRRADYIFLTKSNGGNHLRHAKSFLRRHNRRAEIIECCHKPQYLEAVRDSSERWPLDHMAGRKIAAMSGIAWPESFEEALEKLGAEIVFRARFADHHRFGRRELEKVMQQAVDAGAEMLITTEKDAVRMPEDVNHPKLPMLFMRVEIDIISGHENFAQSVSRICFV